MSLQKLSNFICIIFLIINISCSKDDEEQIEETAQEPIELGDKIIAASGNKIFSINSITGVVEHIKSFGDEIDFLNSSGTVIQYGKIIIDRENVFYFPTTLNAFPYQRGLHKYNINTYASETIDLNMPPNIAFDQYSGSLLNKDNLIYAKVYDLNTNGITSIISINKNDYSVNMVAPIIFDNYGEEIDQLIDINNNIMTVTSSFDNFYHIDITDNNNPIIIFSRTDINLNLTEPTNNPNEFITYGTASLNFITNDPSFTIYNSLLDTFTATNKDTNTFYPSVVTNNTRNRTAYFDSESNEYLIGVYFVTEGVNAPYSQGILKINTETLNHEVLDVSYGNSATTNPSENWSIIGIIKN